MPEAVFLSGASYGTNTPCSANLLMLETKIHIGSNFILMETLLKDKLSKLQNKCFFFNIKNLSKHKTIKQQHSLFIHHCFSSTKDFIFEIIIFLKSLLTRGIEEAISKHFMVIVWGMILHKLFNFYNNNKSKYFYEHCWKNKLSEGFSKWKINYEIIGSKR